MQHPFFEELLEAKQAIEEAKVKVMTALGHSDLSFLRNRIENQFNIGIRAINAVTGNNEPLAEGSQQIGPVQTIMGMPVLPLQPVAAGDTEPTLDDKQKFIRDRDALLRRFPAMSNKQLVNYMEQPNGELHIRSVAKMLGLEDFRSAELNVNYFQSMRDAMTATNETEAAVKKADKGAKELKEKPKAEESDGNETEAAVKKEQTPPAPPTPAPDAPKSAPKKNAPKKKDDGK